MMKSFTESWLFVVLEIMGVLFMTVVGVAVVCILVMYILDVTQSKQAIRRNYPVVGRFRYAFEHMGEFFRQYFFAMDREELPFNRADRSWAYRAAKDVDSTIAFGSTRDLRPVGSIYFVNCPYPPLGSDVAQTQAVTIGPDCQFSYAQKSVINISGMSFGALSAPAVRALAWGAKRAGCWLNTGEGGLSPYHLESGADIVFQIGTAKFGVRDENGDLCDKRLADIAGYRQVKMFEIKLSQGAKPGKGGILPGEKVTEEIASIRGIPVGKDAISPNRHAEIESAGELLDMVNHVRTITGKPTGFKTVVGGFDWLDDLFSLINQRGKASAPDFITIDGADGGTGAAPMSLMDAVGMPLQDSLPAVVDLLNRHALRQRVKIICAGKLITPVNVAWALAVGADFVTSARGFMFALGCIQSLQCNKNTCPTGITTHDKKLQRGLDPTNKAQRVANYVKNMNYEVGVIAHSCGLKEPRQFRRHHARMVTATGGSVPINELFPDVEPIASFPS